MEIAELFDYVAISPLQYLLCALAIMLATAVQRMTG
jgi:hypothetical protein